MGGGGAQRGPRKMYNSFEYIVSSAFSLLLFYFFHGWIYNHKDATSQFMLHAGPEPNSTNQICGASRIMAQMRPGLMTIATCTVDQQGTVETIEERREGGRHVQRH